MAFDRRYREDPRYEEYAREIFEPQIGDAAFDTLVGGLVDDRKAAFFGVTAFYKYLVRDIRFSFVSREPVPAYIENTQRFLAIVALIEALEGIGGPRQRFQAFVGRLDPECKRRLERSVRRVDRINWRLSLAKVADHLYDLRSEFVHEAEFATVLSDHQVLSDRRQRRERAILLMQLPFKVFSEMFEHGVLAKFGFVGELPHVAWPRGSWISPSRLATR